MSTAIPTSRARRRELTRAEIIDTSTRLFVRNGYEQTTLGGVAEAVGISVPTLLKAAAPDRGAELTPARAG